GHVVEGITRLHREFAGVEAKGDATRHIEHDIVTTTLYIDTGTAHAVAQFLLLAVHIGTNTRPGRRAHRRANQRTVTTAGAATTGKRPCRSPYRHTNTRAGASTRTLGLTRVGDSRGTANHQQAVSQRHPQSASTNPGLPGLE